MNRDTHQKIIEKSKTKKDGIYSLGGFRYIVKNNKPTYCCDNFGNIFLMQASFIVSIGKIEYGFQFKETAKKNRWL